MIKNLTTLEHVIGDKVFQFACHPEATLGQLHDALSAMKAFVISKMQEFEKQGEKIVEAIPDIPVPAQPEVKDVG
jgi:hypothetical protein